MGEVWHRIETWLAREAPLVLDGLRPGASPERIRETEAVLGFMLPEEFPREVVATGMRDWLERYPAALEAGATSSPRRNTSRSSAGRTSTRAADAYRASVSDRTTAS